MPSNSNDSPKHVLAVDPQDMAAALRQQNSLLEATLQATADGILAVSGDGAVMSYNRQFVELWRVPPDLLEKKERGNAGAIPRTPGQ